MGKYAAARDLDLSFKKRWFLVANRTEAVIYEDTPLSAGAPDEIAGQEYRFVVRMTHPDGKKLENEFVSDKPGRVISSANANIHHSVGSGPIHQERSAMRFARDIDKFLKRSAMERLYTELVVVAEPRFLGILRGQMDSQVKKLVTKAIHREFNVHVPHQELWAELKSQSL